MATSVSPSSAMGEHSLACRLVRFVILLRSLEYFYNESVEGCFVILRPTCQLIMEVRRHANLEVNHSFGHRRLLKSVRGGRDRPVDNHIRSQIEGAIKK